MGIRRPFNGIQGTLGFLLVTTTTSGEMLVGGLMHLAMTPDEQIAGLHRAAVWLNSMGEAEFQVVAQGSEEMVYHPLEQRTAAKWTRVFGPALDAKEGTWLIRGSPGEMYEVEFFKGSDAQSLVWRPCLDCSG